MLLTWESKLAFVAEPCPGRTQVSKGDGEEPLYIVECDLAGRTMNVVNPAGETCIFIQKRHAANVVCPLTAHAMIHAGLARPTACQAPQIHSACRPLTGKLNLVSSCKSACL